MVKLNGVYQALGGYVLVVCDFCKSKYQRNDLEFCPGCGAKLTRIPDPPKPPTPQYVPPKYETSSSAKTLRPAALAVFAVIFVVCVMVAAIFAGISKSKTPPTIHEYPPDGPLSSEVDERQVLNGEMLTSIMQELLPNGEITAEAVKTVTYLSIYETDTELTIGYSFDAAITDDYTPQYAMFPTSSDSRAMLNGELLQSGDLDKFENLQYLETNYSFQAKQLAQLHSLKYLACNYSDADLSGLESLEALEALNMDTYKMTSLSGIEKLPSLKSLALERSDDIDLALLKQCSKLKSLSITNCDNLTGLSSIGDLGGLTQLEIVDSEDLDFGYIGKLKMLESLTLSNTKSKTLAFVGELPNLKTLTLERNSDAKIMPSFERVTALEELTFDAIELEDVSFLSPLVNLKRLAIYNTPSVAPFAGMTKLEELELSPGYAVESLAPLGNITSLKKLTFIQNVSFTPYNNSTFAFLSQLTNLEELSLANCGLYFNADPVYGLAKLKVLDFSGNTACGNFASIKNLTALESLNLAKTHLAQSFYVESDGFITSIGTSGEQTVQSQVSNLAALSSLKMLNVSNTELEDITFVKNLKNLTHFYANDNYITDVFVLSELPSLRVADLSANAISNWETLDALTNTEIIGKPKG